MQKVFPVARDPFDLVASTVKYLGILTRMLSNVLVRPYYLSVAA